MKILYLLISFFIVGGAFATEDKIINDRGTICLSSKENGKYNIDLEGKDLECNLLLKIRNGQIVNMTTMSTSNHKIVTANHYVVKCEQCEKLIASNSDEAGNGDTHCIMCGLCDECAKVVRRSLL